MRAAEMFKSYPKMKNELLVLEFKLRAFQGIAHDDVIESMNYSKPQGERVQDSRISDKTGKTAIYYRKIAEKLDDEYFDALLERYLYLKEALELFEFLVSGLSGRLPDFIRDRVMEQMSWTELMEKYCISYSAVGKYRKKAEKELDRLYEFRDEVDTEYMLS